MSREKKEKRNKKKPLFHVKFTLHLTSIREKHLSKAESTSHYSWVEEQGFPLSGCKHRPGSAEIVRTMQWWIPFSLLGAKWGEEGRSPHKLFTFCVTDLHLQMDNPSISFVEGHTAHTPLLFQVTEFFWYTGWKLSPKHHWESCIVPINLSSHISPKNTLVTHLKCSGHGVVF